MEPRIIYKPAFTIVGFSQELNGNDGVAETLWDKLAAHYQEIPFVDPDVGYGVHLITPESHRYLAGLGVTRPGGQAPAGMSDYRTGPQAYAVFTHSGSLTTLNQTLTQIFQGWLPGADYLASADFYFEYYDDHYQPDSPFSTLFIWVPVTPKSTVDPS